MLLMKMTEHRWQGNIPRQFMKFFLHHRIIHLRNCAFGNLRMWPNSFFFFFLKSRVFDIAQDLSLSFFFFSENDLECGNYRPERMSLFDWPPAQWEVISDTSGHLVWPRIYTLKGGRVRVGLRIRQPELQGKHRGVLKRSRFFDDWSRGGYR